MLRRRIEAVYRKDIQRWLAMAMSVLRRQDLAEDAVHLALERILRTSPVVIRLRAYLLRAVYCAAIDLLRQESRRSIDLSSDWDVEQAKPSNAEMSAEERVVFLETVGLAERWLDELAEPMPNIVRMHLWAGLSFREIARVTQMPLGTVVSHYRRALVRLRCRLVDHEERYSLVSQAKEITEPQRKIATPS